MAREAPHLDVLVNHAGVLLDDAAPSAVRQAVVRCTFEVNVVGPIRVTQAFLPLLRRAPAARVVNLSSGLGSLALTTDPASGYADFRLPAYTASKAALERLVARLHPRGLLLLQFGSESLFHFPPFAAGTPFALPALSEGLLGPDASAEAHAQRVVRAPRAVAGGRRSGRGPGARSPRVQPPCSQPEVRRTR